ncbi:lipocalin-like domain-containing protein [Roseomonas chloroacetimidivorans]|jgi:hypothetical protein|uniref:lipocalin-like domain-containing protein n=1 Tax=Roseomonas chloroacetimidivorans TaxID=1766656 RepID=UPI003C79495E
MKRRALSTIAAWAVVPGLALPEEAAAQTADDVVGSWKLVSLTTADGRNRADLFGREPRGQMILGADGRYMVIVMRRELPTIGMKTRASGTPEENQAIVQGSIAHYGSYTTDESNKILAFRVESSTFPNWDGIEQRRPITLDGDTLTVINPANSAGTGASQIVWRRNR